MLTSKGGADIFVSKLNADGEFVWAKQMGGTSADAGYSIALDGAGNIYTTGQFSLTVDFNPGSGVANLASAGGFDIFVSKLDANGIYLWAKRIGSIYDDVGGALALGSGCILMTGYFQGTVDFDPAAGSVYNLTAFGSSLNKDNFILKIDFDGNFGWARQLGGAGDDVGSFVLPTADGGVLTTGTFAGTVDFDPGSGVVNLTSAGDTDAYLSKLDANGNYVWAWRFGGTGEDAPGALALGGDCSLFCCGEFSNSVDFDPGEGLFNLASDGGVGAFVLKLLERVPTGLQISATAVAEQQAAGTMVGKFMTTDPDPGDSFVYTLVSGSGSEDNASFAIDANGWLVTAAAFDFDVKATYNIRVRTTGHGGAYFEKAFTILVIDAASAIIVAAPDWTDAGLTLIIGGDGKLHAYRTGTTIDAVPPKPFASVSIVQITGRDNADDELTIDIGMGNPIPAGGMTFNGGTQIGGDTFILKTAGGNDNVTLKSAQVVCSGIGTMNYVGVELFGFELGGGTNHLTIDGATLNLNKANAISAGTNVTVAAAAS